MNVQIKDERINLRLGHNAKKILERAASFEGKTVSNFILKYALEHAEKTMREHEIMQLNAKDAEAFFDALAAPVKLNEKLISAIREHEKRVINK